MPPFGKCFGVTSKLSLGTRVSNLKSVALTVLELLAFNSYRSAAHTHRQTDAHTSNKHIISTIHFVHLAEIIKNKYTVTIIEYLRARVGCPRFSSFREKRVWSLWSFQPSYAIHFLGYIYDYVVFWCRNRCSLRLYHKNCVLFVINWEKRHSHFWP